MTEQGESDKLDKALEGGTDIASKLMGASMGLLGPTGILAGPPVE
jgi:hypothetical protein